MTTRGTPHSERWRTNEGESLRRAVEDRLRQGKSPEGLGFGEHEGRLDLRGLPLSAAVSRVTGVSLASADLGGAGLANLTLDHCEIDNCQFSRADCQYWRISDTTISGCSFAGADLRDSTLGDPLLGGVVSFEDVDFSKANLLRCVCRSVSFVRCTFANTKFQRFEFHQSTLSACRFTGLLDEVIFDGRPGPGSAAELIDVDFSGAEFRGVEFRGLSLDRVTLPADPDLIVVPNGRVIDLLAGALPSGGKPSERDVALFVLEAAREVLDMGGPALINLGDVPKGSELIRQAWLDLQSGSTA